MYAVFILDVASNKKDIVYKGEVSTSRTLEKMTIVQSSTFVYNNTMCYACRNHLQ